MDGAGAALAEAPQREEAWKIVGDNWCDEQFLQAANRCVEQFLQAVNR